MVLDEFLGGAGGLGHRLEMVAFDFRMAEGIAIVLVMVALARRRWAPWYDAGVSPAGG